ncbi:MAG: hypothetical protein IPL01_21865 [Acidobacteria bacterium]|nr:hypothetical protein [Acidobacteriota bacterium]
MTLRTDEFDTYRVGVSACFRHKSQKSTFVLVDKQAIFADAVAVRPTAINVKTARIFRIFSSCFAPFSDYRLFIYFFLIEHKAPMYVTRFKLLLSFTSAITEWSAVSVLKLAAITTLISVKRFIFDEASFEVITDFKKM